MESREGIGSMYMDYSGYLPLIRPLVVPENWQWGVGLMLFKTLFEPIPG